MAKPFTERLCSYFEGIAAALAGTSTAASVFPNSTDIGQSRERLYLEFLRVSMPSKCNVFLGGFLFQTDGSESGQMDVIVTSDTAPRFDFHNPTGDGKSFSPVEQTLAVASVKSELTKATLFDALGGLSSIPPMLPIGGRCMPDMVIHDYEHWPLKIIYAPKGLNVETIEGHMRDYYELHPEIPPTRRPDIVHVGQTFALVSGNLIGGVEVTNEDGTSSFRDVPHDEHITLRLKPDLQAMIHVVRTLHKRASVSNFVLMDYSRMFLEAVGRSVREP